VLSVIVVACLVVVNALAQMLVPVKVRAKRLPVRNKF